tara:strand:- start:294 stop:908 length:615 start_codon:yes stop_codon:yes gene_type:complete
MDLPIDILKIIMQPIFEITLPHKLYKLRLISKDFKSIIDEYDKGFYVSLKNALGIKNNTYNLLINEKLRKSYINLNLGLKIIVLDDWNINVNTTLKELCYPKWEKKINGWEYTFKEESNKYIKISKTLNKNKLYISCNEYNKDWIKISDLDYEYEYDINTMTDYQVEKNVIEKYKNEMEKMFLVFKKVKSKNTIKWLKQNGELK